MLARRPARLPPRLLLALRRPASSAASAPDEPQPSVHPRPQPQQPASPADRALPAPADGDDVTRLDISRRGTTVKLAALGPLVVNGDGSVSRISNWADMTAPEKETTLRLLGKRNKLRLASLSSQADDSREPKQ